MKRSIVIGLFFFSSFTQAFTLNSSSNSDLKGWGTSEVQLLVNTANCPAGVDVVSIIQAAVDVWNNVPTSKIKVSYGGTTTSTNFSSPPTVYCETNFQTIVGGNQNYVPGAASVNGSTGSITQGILYLNASTGNANIANFDTTTLTIILAHEIGHLLGLGHSTSTSALMYYDATARKKLSLSQDDMDGISYLYPSDELKGDKVAGCGLVKDLPPPPAGGLGVFLMLLMLPLAYWSHLRSKTGSA